MRQHGGERIMTGGSGARVKFAHPQPRRPQQAPPPTTQFALRHLQRARPTVASSSGAIMKTHAFTQSEAPYRTILHRTRQASAKPGNNWPCASTSNRVCATCKRVYR